MSNSNNRRNFLKLTGLAGLGVATGGFVSCSSTSGIIAPPNMGTSGFNMSGYAAPKIETVKIGLIGLGMRGPSAVKRMSHIEGVELPALCDSRTKQRQNAKKLHRLERRRTQGRISQ